MAMSSIKLDMVIRSPSNAKIILELLLNFPENVLLPSQLILSFYVLMFNGRSKNYHRHPDIVNLGKVKCTLITLSY